MAFSGVALEEGHRAKTIVRVVTGGKLLQYELRSVVLLDNLESRPPLSARRGLQKRMKKDLV